MSVSHYRKTMVRLFERHLSEFYGAFDKALVIEYRFKIIISYFLLLVKCPIVYSTNSQQYITSQNVNLKSITFFHTHAKIIKYLQNIFNLSISLLYNSIIGTTQNVESIQFILNVVSL